MSGGGLSHSTRPLCRASRRCTFGVLEGLGELSQLLFRQTQCRPGFTPLGNGTLNPAENLVGPRPGNPAVSDDRKERFNSGLGTGIFRDPGFQLTHAIREWVEIERGSQPPLPTTRMEKPVVAQMIVHVGDQY